ncbi:hypothetical protein PF049_03810 [Erythrobacteraceae bacterium WH01K]|nr:hypothetical protein PF049_03810 [Erythrobacteraceae bacterium WH01K]
MDGNETPAIDLSSSVKAIVGLGALLLAVAAMVFAASAAMEKRRPDISVLLNPFMADASSRLARGVFAASAGEGTPEDLATGAREARKFAQDAYRVKPLSPDALTLLAWASESAPARTGILLNAATLNKRSSMLSGAVLTVHSQNEDVEAALDTLNNFLAVHPEKIDALEPFLIQTLSNPQGPGVFRRVFRDEPLWMDEFIARAGRDGTALENLFAITDTMDTGKTLSRRTNIVLMRRYLEVGRLEQAFATYQGLVSDRPLQKPACRIGSANRLDWCTDLAPFDWRLGEGATVSSVLISPNPKVQFRATQTGRELIAQRIVQLGDEPASLRVDYTSDDSAFGDNVNVSVICATDRRQLFNATLSSLRASEGAEISADCDFVIFTLVSLRSVRAAPTRGSIDGVRFD